MKTERESVIVTVAAIRRPKDEGVTEYLFNERQQIFTLRSAAKSFEEFSRRLKQALGENLPVKAHVDSRRALIEKIEAPSPREMDEFQRGRILLEKPDKALPVDVESIDPTTFNIVDRYLKFPTFQLVPDCPEL